jgi:hypothetical protein
MAFEEIKYAQRKRLEYLDRLFFWNGAATRGSLIEQFGISNAQAALDFRAYLKDCKEDTLQYDATLRQYLAQSTFERLTGPAETSELFELFSHESHADFDSLPNLQRTQNVKAFVPLYRAMRANQSVEIVYQSMKEDEPYPETRQIAPVRFVSDGVRLHVRAYCYMRQEFRDFIPSRIDLDLSFRHIGDAEGIPPDDDWYTWTIFKLRPHKRLSESQKRVVRTEFGFTDEILEIRIRKALEFYPKRRWGLEQEFPRLECLSTNDIPMTEEEINGD